MGKPRLIILIRHAQSEGNKNRDIHQTVPDHRVRLTPEGHQQALEAGRKLRALLRPEDTLHFFTSPYRRTRETTEGILTSLTSDDPSPSPFPRSSIKVYEEPRLREQDFGNFQPCSAEMERMWQERADYGHFFYRIPDGESAADAYDRVSGFNDSLWRRFEENDFASVCILVTHGLMTRVFLMKWYHFSVEYFEDLRNVNHCEFVVMKKSLDSNKFILQNQLRTWSEYRHERAARENASQVVPSAGHSPIPTQRRWGGCPDGCNHAQHAQRGGPGRARALSVPKRQNTADLFRDDLETRLSPPKSSSSRQSSVSLNQISRSGSRQALQDTLTTQVETDSGNADNGDDNKLSDDEDTILDQDPHKSLSAPPSAGHSPVQTMKIPFKPRHHNGKAVGTPLDESITEETALTSHAEGEGEGDGHLTPRPNPQFTPFQTIPRQSFQPDLPPEILRRKLRNPREASLIAMAGRDGGGTRSGYGSTDEDTDGEREKEKGKGKEDSRTKALTTQAPAQATYLSSLSRALKGQTIALPVPLPAPIPVSTSALSQASPYQPHELLHIDTTSSTIDDLFPPSSTLVPASASASASASTSTFDSRALADALGDQSDAEITEDDEESGLRSRLHREEERILKAERAERRLLGERIREMGVDDVGRNEGEGEKGVRGDEDKGGRGVRDDVY